MYKLQISLTSSRNHPWNISWASASSYCSSENVYQNFKRTIDVNVCRLRGTDDARDGYSNVGYSALPLQNTYWNEHGRI
jgi:hypothetical protein